MTKKFLAWIMILSCLLPGCSAKEEPVSGSDHVSSAGVSTAEVSDNSGNENFMEQQTAVYAYSDTTVMDAETGKMVFRITDPHSADMGSIITQAVGSEEMLFVLTRGKDDEHILTLVDRGGNTTADASELIMQNIDTIPRDKITDLNIGFYQGKCYVLYDEHDHEAHKITLNIYCYERQPDGSFVKERDTICETVMKLQEQEYRLCSRRDIFTCLNEGDFLMMWKREEAKVSAFGTDGNLLWEHSIDPDIVFIRGTDGRYLIGRGDISSSEDECNYYIYDFGGTDIAKEPIQQGSAYSEGIRYMGMQDGYAYYQREEKWAYRRYLYQYFRCPLNSVGEEELLFETTDAPGLPDWINGMDDFTLQGDACYFLKFDEGSLWWYSCDLADETHPLTRHGLVEEYRGLFDVGKISYQSGEYLCSDCGALIYEYYAEQLRLSEEVVPHAEVINPILLGKTEAFEEYAKELGERMASEVCEVSGTGSFVTWHVEGVTQYAFHKTGQEEELICLEADYLGYSYGSGGAHGLPSRARYFFNLADGSEMTIGDIVSVSEEEFRVLAAEYTLEDCRERNELYSYDADGNSYSDNGVTLYDEVYEYAGFDKLMHLGPEGVVMEYYPYHLGGYASGFIKVTIPYEELGLELEDIYGVRERD